MVVPHAGINVSGPIAAHAFAELKKDDHHDAYIIIGPDHYGQPYDVVMSSEPYRTPMGTVPVHRELADRLGTSVPDHPSAHRREHSIEVVLPFLQYVDPEARIVPIIMGRQDPDTARDLAETIRRCTEDIDAVIIASSDLMHYVPDSEEKEKDGAFLERVCECDIDGMYREVYGNDLSICGYGPIAAASIASGSESARLLKHSNSWETIGYDRDSVVGYASLILG